MHCNYHFLQHLVPQLQAKLQGKALLDCYSQNKDELIMEFGTGQPEFYLKAYLTAKFACLSFPQAMNRARKNSVSLFEQVIGRKILAVHLVTNDRSFYLEMEDGHQLLFKMHGNRSNILLFKGEELLDIFNNQLKKDREVTIATLAKQLDQSKEAWLANPDIKAVFPTFGKEVWGHLEDKGWEGADPEAQWLLVQDTLALLDRPLYHIERRDGPPVLTFFPTLAASTTCTDPLEACNTLMRQYTQVYLPNETKEKASKTLAARVASLQSYLHHSHAKLGELSEKRPYSQLADLLMANLHQIPKGATKVTLHDFYTMGSATIKLPNGQSPQKVAENYYRKTKNQGKETDMLLENILRKEAELQQTTALLQELESLHDYKALVKFTEAHLPGTQHSQEAAQVPYHQHLYQGYTILVGKNAKANDELLRHHTSKNDLWLHARDTAGSHVVIKEKKLQNYPEPVIEQAAKLAAYYSKAKNDTLCPVIYTPRKYVRKAKHLAPGQVIVEKEKVILVEPGIDN